MTYECNVCGIKNEFSGSASLANTIARSNGWIVYKHASYCCKNVMIMKTKN